MEDGGDILGQGLPFAVFWRHEWPLVDAANNFWLRIMSAGYAGPVIDR